MLIPPNFHGRKQRQFAILRRRSKRFCCALLPYRNMLPRFACYTARQAKTEVAMFAQIAAEGRVLGFDRGDWLLLFSGFFFAGLLTLLA